MKKLIKTLALVLTTASLSFANPNPEPKTFKIGMYNVVNSHVLKVNIRKERGEAIELTVLDEKNNVKLRSNGVKNTEGNRFIVDMSDLPVGEYTIQIKTKSETYNRTVKLVNEQSSESKIEL
ncbi:MAG: hypothetical protein ACRCVT_05890 [Leadbetterella sp.]